MAERAKLRYESVSYYDIDLINICSKACKSLNYIYHSYKIDRKTGFLIVYGFEQGNHMLLNSLACIVVCDYLRVKKEKQTKNYHSGYLPNRHDGGSH